VCELIFSVSSSNDPTEVQLQEAKSSCQAAIVEKERLNELVQVIQNRLGTCLSYR